MSTEDSAAPVLVRLTRICAVLLLTVFGAGGSHADAAAPLSEGQIAAIFENIIGRSCAIVKLGPTAVGNKMINAHVLSEDQFQNIRAWGAAGLVDVQVTELQGARMLVTGIHQQVLVTPLPAGLNESSKSPCAKRDPGFLAVQFVRQRLTSIISSEEVKTPVDTFRVVKGSASNEVTEVGLTYFRARGITPWKGYKFIMLLKLDSFANEWKYVVHDSADVAADFTTNNVQKALAAVGR